MVTMVNAKGKGESSSSNSNPNTNEAANPVQTETSASSPIKMNVEEVVVVYEIRDQEENAIEEVKNKENSIVAVRNEGNAIEDEKNEENAHEEDENNEENAMVEGENEENSIEEENATEEKNEEIAAEEEKNEEEAEADSKEKVKKSRKSRKKKVARRGSKAVNAKDKDKPESSSKKKSSKKAESMGMIFMCSSKTKKDCYRYKVLGLPASKRDTVQKIYKGMRLFLFDFDLRLMYGIYKAAGPGGYNIEPKAFKSAFPSQVQFTVLEDCLPLSEEKFRKVIKDNYYTRNKFDCQLTSEQVKNLCKLFLASSKGPKSKKLGRSLREETHTSVDRNRTRRRARDKERRHSALGGDRRYHEHPVMYEREAFATLVAPLPQVPSLPPPAPAPSYAYERTLERPVYRQDPLFEHRDHELLDLEQRRRDETEHHDPYNSYREPPSYRDPLYSAGLPPEYHRLAQPASEYRRPAQPASDYRRLAQPESEYRRLAQPVSEYRRLAQPESEYRRLAQPVSEYRRLAQPVSEYRSAPVLPPEYDPLRPFYRY